VPAAAASDDVTRTAGRGGIAVAFAKVYFIVIGLVQQVILPRVLGLDGYGAWSTVQSVASIAYNPVTSTSIQGVSRAVAHSSDVQQPQAIRNTLKIHAALALPLAALFFALAEPIASVAKAPHVLAALRIVSALMLLYGLYTPLIGVVNGLKKFLYQAGLDILSATLRTIGLIAVGYWFATRYARGIEGAAIGVVSALALTFLIAVAIVGTGRAGSGGPTVKQHLLFIAPLFLGQAVLNLLLQADSLLLRRFSGEAALATGLPATAADPLIGAYRATQLFSFLPYQLLIAVTFILFPMLATAHRDGDVASVARYVRTGVRLALVLAGVMVSVTCGLAGPLLRLFFGPQAAELGTRAMQLLTLGFGAFAILGVLTTVLNSIEQERRSAALTTLAFTLVVVLGFLRVRGTPFGEELLWRMATATSTGLVLATILAAYFVKRSAGAVVAPSSVGRVLVACAAAIALGRVLPQPGKIMTLAYALLLAATYVVLLIALRELGRADVDMVNAVISRRERR
jgi:stage V sporulation protein B